MAIRREQHFTESPHPTDRKQRRRKIQNYLNFREGDPSAGWEETDPGADVASGEPDGWGGNFTFTYYHRKGAIQCALGIDGSGRPHARLRLASRRSIWVEYVWLGGGTATMNHVNRRVEFNGYKSNIRFAYAMARHKVNSRVRLLDSPHDTFVRYQMRVAPGMSWQLLGDGTILLRDDQGVEVMRLPPPTGEDSSTVAPTPTGKQPIGVTVTQDADVGGFPTFRWTPDPSDLASAVYPVVIS
jgi:hypothetical protein